MTHRRKDDPFIKELVIGKILKTSCQKKECPAFKTCSNIPIEVVGNGKLDFLFIGGPATHLEMEIGRPFSSRNGTTLRNIVYLLKKEYKKDITYALAHVTRNVNEPNVKRTVIDYEIESCSVNIRKAIYSLEPKVVVLLGRDAVTSVLQTKISLDKYRGTFETIKIKDKKFKVYFTYNPSFGIMNPDRLGDIYYDIACLMGRKKPVINIEYGPKKEKDYKVITTIKEAKKVLGKMFKSSRPLIFDVESDSLSKFDSNILTLQFYNGGKYGYCLPWTHPETPFSNSDFAALKKILKKLFSLQARYPFIVGHNLKYDYTIVFTRLGITIHKPLFDTMAGAYLLDETHTKDDEDDTDAMGGTGGYGLGSQLLLYGFYDEWYIQAKHNRANLANENLDYVARYGVGDVVLNWELMRCQFEEAREQRYSKEWKNLLINFYSHQIKLFTDLELNGILVDTEYLGILTSPEKSPLIKFIAEIKEELHSLSNVKKANKKLNSAQRSVFGDVWMFDIQKPDHKQLLFIDVMGLEPLSYGKLKDGSQGAPSLNKKFQKQYMDEHREVELLFYLSRANQLFNLYPKSFREILSTDPDCRDGRIRPSFFGTRTRSGRGAARKPNTQQTIRSGETDTPDAKLADIIRGLYTCELGNVIIKLDLMANEVRCWGEVAKDGKLKKSVLHGMKLRAQYFNEGPNEALYKKVKLEGDLHRTNAAEFNTKPVTKVTADDRQSSKDTTFGTIYGLTTGNLAKRLKKTYKATQKIKQKFFDTFRAGKKWLDGIIVEGKNKLFVESFLGRRRRLWFFLIQWPLSKHSTMEDPQLNDEDRYVSTRIGQGERRAMNSPIQGIGSDLAFIASFLMRSYIKRNRKNWKLFNVVHDSLEAEVPVDEISEYILVSKVIFERLTAKFIKKYFDHELFMPIEVDFEVGFTFREMKKWDGAYRNLQKLEKEMIIASRKRKPTQDISELDIAA